MDQKRAKATRNPRCAISLEGPRLCLQSKSIRNITLSALKVINWRTLLIGGYVNTAHYWMLYILIMKKGCKNGC